jgi:K+-sensing histidine kinase KdpD
LLCSLHSRTFYGDFLCLIGLESASNPLRQSNDIEGRGLSRSGFFARLQIQNQIAIFVVLTPSNFVLNDLWVFSRLVHAVVTDVLPFALDRILGVFNMFKKWDEIASLRKRESLSPALLKEAADVIGIAIVRGRAAEAAKEAEIARRSAELKSAIFDAMAHEARGPLGSISIAATTLLSVRPGNTRQQREMLGIIKEEVERMNQWIDEAARTGQIDARKLTMDHRPQDVRDLVSGALDPPHPLLRGRQVAVRIEDAIPKADCDAATTRRILKLLLDNALKYLPSGTPITISSNLDRGAISISVSDFGPGIAADDQPRIFEEHYRCSQHTSVFGTGLGFASAKKLVEWQGGQIWVTNRPEGGAAFHFSVPVANGAKL